MSDLVPVADARMLELLGKSGLFGSLSADELSVVAEYGAFRSYRPGSRIFRQGSRARELYIVAEGAVVVRKSAGDGQEQDLATFTAGEVLGEIDLLDTVPRNASAYADGPAAVLVFPAAGLSFRDIVEGHPQIFAPVLHTLLGTVANRIRGANRLLSDRTPWIRELQKQLHRDKLTGLYNRTWLDDELDALLRRHPRVSLLVVKPDNFKTINDTFGHEAGDRVLLMTAELLKNRLREGEIGARYRGDENCVILPGSGTEEAVRRAEELREAIGGMDLRPVTGGRELKLAVSVGVSTFPEHAGEAKKLVARSFEQMHAARSAGGDRTLWSCES